MTINEKIVEVALSLVGITEVNAKNIDFTSHEFKRDLISCGWKKGQPYCAFTAEIVWKRAYSAFDATLIKDIDKLFSGNAVRTFERAAKMHPELIIPSTSLKKPQKGALVVFQKFKNNQVVEKDGWVRGHMGTVIETKYNETYHSFEGNTFDKIEGREGNGNFVNRYAYNDYWKKNGLKRLGFINPIPA